MALKLKSTLPSTLDTKHVRWNDWRTRVNGHDVDLELLDEYIDEHSTVEFIVGTRVDGLSILERASNIRLHASVACLATGVIKSQDNFLKLEKERKTFESSVSVTFKGTELADEIRLSANLIEHRKVPPREQWRSSLSVASMRTQKANLISGVRDFPTTGFSFRENNYSDVPWQFEISFTDISENFFTGFRLLLNSDFPRVKKLETDKADAATRSALDKAVMTAILQSVAHTYLSSESDKSPDQIAVDNPDSVAEAARRIAVEQLEYDSLEKAIRSYEKRPHSVNQRIDAKCGYLK